MWNVNTKVIPVMIRANGTRDHSEIPEPLSGKHEIKELRRTAILSTAHSSRNADIKVLNVYHGKYHYV